MSETMVIEPFVPGAPPPTTLPEVPMQMHSDFLLGGENVIPRAVREAAAASDALVRQLNAGTLPPDAGAAAGRMEPHAVPQQTQVNTGPTNAAVNWNDVLLSGIDPPLQIDQPLATPPQPQSQPQPGEWEQQYRTLKGKYDNEVPTLRRQLTEMSTTINGLQALVGTMRAAPTAAAAATEAAPVDPQDVEAYGELVGKAQDWALARITPELNAMRNELALLRGTTQQQQVLSAQERCHQALDAQVADWREINGSSAFENWLMQIDILSGQTRQSLLAMPYQSGDAARVVAFFKAFLAEHTGVTGLPATTHTPPAIPAPAGGGGTGPVMGLAAFASPSPARGPSGTVGAPPLKRNWTTAQIAAFTKDNALGKVDAKVAAAAWADIQAAYAEGRVFSS